MIYKVHITKNFRAELKPLAKKDRTLSARVYKELRNFQVRSKISLGANVYKMRIRRGNQGKSGSYRIYIYLLETQGMLVPLTIFAKNQKPDISEKELSGHLRATKIELKLFL